MDPIITASGLAERLAGPHPPAVLDVRWRLGGGPSGRHDYEAGHIPGAHFVDLDTELAGPPGPRGRHPLPEPRVFEAAMRRAGVGTGREVAVYDDGGGMTAARAWWLLRWAGHDPVRVLDGGLRSWSAAGLPVEREVPADEDGDFTARPGGLPLLCADEAAELARTGLLLDARAAERYRGETEPVDRVAGHIPGSASAPTTENLADDGRFRSPEDLASRFAALGAGPGTRVGVYCGSGVTAAHQVLALQRAGIPAALYVGSWSEWSHTGERPIATGPERG